MKDMNQLMEFVSRLILIAWGDLVLNPNCLAEITCNDDETVIDGECVLNDQSIRTITALECEHLDNIAEWQPVWCDEFEGEGLPDPDKWGYDFGPDWNDGERQYYTYQDLNNVSQENGMLSITADSGFYLGKSFTSAQIKTEYSGDFLYGRFQIRAKLPEGKRSLDWNPIASNR